MLEKQDLLYCHERTDDWMHEEEGSDALCSAANTLATCCKLLDAHEDAQQPHRSKAYLALVGLVLSQNLIHLAFHMCVAESYLAS